MRGVHKRGDRGARDDRATAGRTALIAALVIMGAARCPWAGPVNPAPVLHAGAVALGVNGSLTTIEGITSGGVALRGGRFWPAPGGLAGVELGLGYNHVSSLDQTDIEADVSWQRRIGTGGQYPYVALGGGLRHEEIGSFGVRRYPFGFSVGLRSLVGEKCGVRVEYRFRRIFDDPVSDYSEQELTVGLSLFLRNSSRAGGEQ
jgi:hypothetical protein